MIIFPILIVLSALTGLDMLFTGLETEAVGAFGVTMASALAWGIVK
jgi:hypothetical protein